MVLLPSLAHGLRVALVLSMSLGFVAWSGHRHAARAESDDDGGDDEGGDDEAGGKGDDEGPEEDEDAKEQPAVTAGGLFTMNSYPVRELFRPLTITQHIAQFRIGLGTDLSALGAFGSGGASVEGIYGVTDNFSVIGGLTDAYNFKQFGLYAGFEAALAYDLVDFRLAANIHRNAIPEFCGLTATPPPECTDVMGMFHGELPDGNYSAGDTKFSIDVGFPFRYAFKPEIALVALQTLMSIDFNSVDRDHVNIIVDPVTMVPTPTPASNKAKPDFNPSVGVAANPVPQLSVVLFAQLRIPDFNPTAGGFQVPVTGRVEFSPSQKFDVGLEFTLLNVNAPDGQSPIDNRFLTLFVQTRVGK